MKRYHDTATQTQQQNESINVHAQHNAKRWNDWIWLNFVSAVKQQFITQSTDPCLLMGHSHTCCAGMVCIGNSVYFNRGVHTFELPAQPVTYQHVCECAIKLFLSLLLLTNQGYNMITQHYFSQCEYLCQIAHVNWKCLLPQEFNGRSRKIRLQRSSSRKRWKRKTRAWLA